MQAKPKVAQIERIKSDNQSQAKRVYCECIQRWWLIDLHIVGVQANARRMLNMHVQLDGLRGGSKVPWIGPFFQIATDRPFDFGKPKNLSMGKIRGRRKISIFFN